MRGTRKAERPGKGLHRFAEATLKLIKSHNIWIEEFKKAQSTYDDLEVLEEFLKEGEVSEEEVNTQYAKTFKALENLEFKSTLNNTEDQLDAVLEDLPPQAAPGVRSPLRRLSALPQPKKHYIFQILTEF